MNKKISIIIPAYNREKTIARCLDSVLQQTYQNIEVIVVNDGSVDSTKKIIDSYQDRFAGRLVAIHTKNEGVSEARNTGIQAATGEYIGFLDSDDYIEPTMYEKLMRKSLEADFDLVACNTKIHYPDRTVIVDSNINDNQSIHQLLVDAYAVLWNKLYKAELIKTLRFKKDYWYEDVLFLYELYPKLHKVGAIADAEVNYVQNEGSITYTYNEKLYQLVENMDDIIHHYKKLNIFDNYKSELEYSYVRYLFGTFVKRLAKSKNYDEYKKGVSYVISKVSHTFPEYRKNIYLKQRNGKSLYLRYFNSLISKVIYLKEKNKLN